MSASQKVRWWILHQIDRCNYPCPYCYPPDIADRISKMQADRIWMASHFNMNLNHRACRIYTRMIRNYLYDMDEEERQFLADEGPEYPVERIR